MAFRIIFAFSVVEPVISDLPASIYPLCHQLINFNLEANNATEFLGQRKKFIISRLLLIAIIVELKSLLTIY
jgi:hypothetical protein